MPAKQKQNPENESLS